VTPLRLAKPYDPAPDHIAHQLAQLLRPTMEMVTAIAPVVGVKVAELASWLRGERSNFTARQKSAVLKALGYENGALSLHRVHRWTVEEPRFGRLPDTLDTYHPIVRLITDKVVKPIKLSFLKPESLTRSAIFAEHYVLTFEHRKAPGAVLLTVKPRLGRASCILEAFGLAHGPSSNMLMDVLVRPVPKWDTRTVSSKAMCALLERPSVEALLAVAGVAKPKTFCDVEREAKARGLDAAGMLALLRKAPVAAEAQPAAHEPRRLRAR
jgi:hypothetical protein